MKSKTSCFNRTIFKKNLTHFWPLWVLYMIYLMLMVPVTLWQRAHMEWFYGYSDKPSKMYSMVAQTLDTALTPVPVFLIAAVMALAVFSYLYTAKSANMMHALPVNRLELYVTNYLSGLSFLVIPEIVVFFVTVLICISNEITCIQYLFVGLLCRFGMIVFAYSLAVFVTMFTGHMLAMPVYYLIVNYLYVGCVFIISCVVELLCYGISDFWNPGKTCILSPPYYLGNNLYTRRIYDEHTRQVSGMEIHGIWLVGIYVAVALVLIAASYVLYRRRRIETAGDMISIRVIKPVFRWGMALCGGILISLSVTEILGYTYQIKVFPCFVVSLVITGFLLFFIAQMLIMKNFRVFRKKRLLEWGCFTIVAILFAAIFELDLFGLEKRVPGEDEIEAAFICMDYPVQMEGDGISAMLALHRQVIDSKKQYRETERLGKDFMYATFRYYLKDGTKVERQYPLPVRTEAAIAEGTPAAQILEWERETENLKKEILGQAYQSNEYLSGYIDLYDEEGIYLNYAFDRDEIALLVAAIERDIEEGNYDSYYLSSGMLKDQEIYYNNISLDYYNSNGYDMWDYYSAYRRYSEERIRTDEAPRTSVYLTFGPDCRHTVAALGRIGAIGEAYQLETMDEHELRMAYD